MGNITKWFNTKITIALVLLVLLGCVSLDAFAATSTTTLAVSAAVTTNCIVSATPLAFGNYNPAAATATDSSATISVFCVIGTSFTVALDAGTTTGGTFAQRRMQNAISASDQLGYNVYRNAARTEIWGDGTSSTFTVTGTGVGLLTAVALTAYGRIPIAQDVSAGAYTDTITVTVTF